MPPNFSCSHIPSHLIYSSKPATEPRHGDGVRGGVKQPQNETSSREQPPPSNNSASECRNQQVRRRRIPGAQPRAARAGAGGASSRPRAGSPSARARAAVAEALPRIPLHGSPRALGSRLRFALGASGGWEQPVPGEYAARLDPAHLGLGGLRVGGVGEWARTGKRAPFRVLRAEGSPQLPRAVGQRLPGDPYPAPHPDLAPGPRESSGTNALAPPPLSPSPSLPAEKRRSPGLLRGPRG